ncbi:MAG: substrate-binding domain-containing protein [Synergistaceae bacterium]|jgi:simple sugar transport system substrate-binding protein|nr:substrate-binding domain-containing protein [Synergistaceae bacterium]
MKKFCSLLVLVLAVVAVVLCPAAGAATKAPAEYRVVMIVKQSDPWFDDMTLGIERLKSEMGVNAYVLTPESGDPALQIAIMEDLISQGVDAICIVPNDPQAILPTVKKARDAGIVVVTHEAPGIASEVNLDVEAFVNAEFGALMGEAVGKAAEGKGEYAGFVGGLTMDTHMEWYKAAVAAIKQKYPDMTNISDEPFEDKNSIEVAYDKTVELLKAYPNLKAIFDCSAHGSGVAQAVKDKGRGDIKVVSLAIPSMSASYIKDGSMVHGQAWRPADAGYATCYAAYLLASGAGVSTGANLKATGYEDVKVEGNIAYGYAPLVFTADNIDEFHF